MKGENAVLPPFVLALVRPRSLPRRPLATFAPFAIDGERRALAFAVAKRIAVDDEDGVDFVPLLAVIVAVVLSNQWRGETR